MITVSKLQRLTLLSAPMCAAALHQPSLEDALDSLNRHHKTPPKGAVGLVRGEDRTVIVHLSSGKAGDTELIIDLMNAILPTLHANLQKLPSSYTQKITKLPLLSSFHGAETIEAALQYASSQAMSQLKLKELVTVTHLPNHYTGTYLLKPMTEDIGVAAALVVLETPFIVGSDWKMQLNQPIQRLCQQILLSRPLFLTKNHVSKDYFAKNQSKAARNGEYPVESMIQKRLERVVCELQPALFDTEDVSVQQALSSLLVSAELHLHSCVYCDSRWKTRGFR